MKFCMRNIWKLIFVMSKFQINWSSGGRPNEGSNMTRDWKPRKQSIQLLCSGLQSLCTTKYLADEGVSYIDGKLYESSFTRTWNHINWVNEEKVMLDGVTKGQSAREECFCSFANPGWSSLFLHQSHIKTHLERSMEHVEGSRSRRYQIWSIGVQEKPRVRKGRLIRVGIGFVAG